MQILYYEFFGFEHFTDIFDALFYTASMRINKYLASCGIASRRGAEELILARRVTLNGKVITELAMQILDGDVVKVDGKVVSPETRKVYVIMNKPRGVVTTCSDDRGRKTVIDLMRQIRNETNEANLGSIRVFPVGRLDYDTEGLLILTNDGDLAREITHPSSEISKVYIATVDTKVTDEHLCDIVSKIGDNTVQVTIHEGKNRQVRKMLAAVGLNVTDLKRVAIGNLTLGKLKPGEFICTNTKPRI